MHDPEGTWKRRGIIAAVLALVLLAGTGIGILVAGNGDDDGTTTDPGTTSPESSAAVESSSTCGLPDGIQEVPSIGPDADWVPFDDLLTPLTEEFGPGEETNGIHSCFARNPTGALIALAVYSSDRNNIEVDQLELARTRYAPVEGYERHIEAQEAGEAAEDDPGTSGQFAGFRFSDYSEDFARIDLALEFTDPEASGALGALTVELQWLDGDWKVVLPENQDFPLTQPRDLSGYVVWAAEPTPMEPDEQPQSAPPTRYAQPELLVGGGGMSRVVVAADEEEPPSDGASDGASDDDGDEGDQACSGVWDCGKRALNPLNAASDVGDLASDGASAAAGSVAGSALEEIAASAQDAAEWAIEELLTAWLAYPDPDVSAEDSVTAWVQANLAGLVVFMMVFSVIAASIRLVLTQQFEHVRDLAGNLTKVILVAGLTTVVVGLGLEIGDELSQYMLDSADIDLGTEAATLIGFAGLTNPILVIVVALIVLATQLVQLALMVIRGAVVVALAGALPVFAAAGSTQTGKQMYTKAVTWLGAFVLYKPVAAFVYMIAIRLTNPDQDVATRLSGLGLMILAIIALPALLRLVASTTGALGNSSGGGLVMAGMGAAVATGAIVATGGTAAAAGGAASGAGAMTGNAPTGGAGPGGPSGGAGPGGGAAGGGPSPQGSKGSPVGPDSDADSKPTLQPVGVGASGGAAGSTEGESGTAAPRHDEGGAQGGAGAPAQGAGQASGGNEALRSFDSASRGAQAGGGAARAAGGSIGGTSTGAAGGDQDGEDYR